MFYMPSYRYTTNDGIPSHVLASYLLLVLKASFFRRVASICIPGRMDSLCRALVPSVREKHDPNGIVVLFERRA